MTKKELPVVLWLQWEIYHWSRIGSWSKRCSWYWGELTQKIPFFASPTFFLRQNSATLLGNVYIVGLNQIYDIDIDKINKPYLPIAAGILSKTHAWQIVIGCFITGMSIMLYACVNLQSGLVPFLLYSVGLAIGTIYSVPPVWKRISINKSNKHIFQSGD